MQVYIYKNPSSIYSWYIDHILEHEFFCLGRLGWPGSKAKKVDLSFSEQLLQVEVKKAFCYQNTPSSMYSWSIDHILEHEFFCLGRLGSKGSKEKKSGFEFF